MPQREEPLVLSLSRPRASIVTWMCRQLAFSRSNSQNSPILGKLCGSPWLTVTSYKRYVLLWMSYWLPGRQTRSVWGINWHQSIILPPQTMRRLNQCRATKFDCDSPYVISSTVLLTQYIFHHCLSGAGTRSFHSHRSSDKENTNY